MMEEGGKNRRQIVEDLKVSGFRSQRASLDLYFFLVFALTVVSFLELKLLNLPDNLPNKLFSVPQ